MKPNGETIGRNRLPPEGGVPVRRTCIDRFGSCLLQLGNGVRRTGRAAVFIAAFLATKSSNASEVKDLNTPREFPTITSRKEWTARAENIREQVLVSCGLWPMPKKSPLEAHIFDRVEREGYTVEKVYIQTLPGFYLAGNLYRPLGRGKGPFPGILNPHGHWKEGRLVDNKEASIPARCIGFARLGMVAFSYDMVGFNDTFFADSQGAPARDFYTRHRQFATNDTCQLWNVSLMGLQTWNSIRALDFLESLPDVDRKRLGCTGESGGGTQTYMLGAIDNRLAIQAPVVMVSHTMQGGCSCENAPGLRVEYSNMDIAAAAAPRPQILVASTGDWTKTTLTMEGPAVQQIYNLFNATEKFNYVRFDFNHNYNRTSREAVYAWLSRWLLKKTDASQCKERDYTKEPDNELRVWPDGKLPANAMSAEQCAQFLIAEHKKELEALLPVSKADMDRFRSRMMDGWRQTLQVAEADPKMEMEWNSDGSSSEWRSALLELKRTEEAQPLKAIYFAPRDTSGSKGKVLVLADMNGGSGYCNEADQPIGLARKLLETKNGVVVIRSFSGPESRNQFANFFTTYNRTLVQRRVRDLVTLCRAVRETGKSPQTQVILCGSGAAGFWTLLAAPGGADATVVDAGQVDVTRDENLLAPELFCPGIRNIGSFEGAALLAAPRPLLIYNAAENFPAQKLMAVYTGNGFRLEHGALEESGIVEWVGRLR